MSEHDANAVGRLEELLLGNGGSIAGTVRMVLAILAFVVIFGAFFAFVRPG